MPKQKYTKKLQNYKDIQLKSKQ